MAITKLMEEVITIDNLSNPKVSTVCNHSVWQSKEDIKWRR